MNVNNKYIRVIDALVKFFCRLFYNYIIVYILVIADKSIWCIWCMQ